MYGVVFLKNIIRVEKLNYYYNENKVLNNLNLNVKECEWLSIIGPNGSGKSTFVRLLVGLNESNDSIIVIDDLLVLKETISEIRKTIGVIFDNPNNQFIGVTVRDDLAFALENLNYEPSYIRQKVSEVADLLGINYILECEPHRLSGGQKQKVALASILVLEPKIIVLDEALSMIDSSEKLDILKLLKKIHKEKKITIINVTNDLEETLYGDRIVVLNKGSKVMEGKTIDVLMQDKELLKLGLELPFMIDLSIKLKFYNLIDNIITDMDEMIDTIWK